MSDKAEIAEIIESGQAVLGLELGSTRIKAVLIGPDKTPLASGGHGWENSQVEGIWTYPLTEVWDGIAAAYSSLKTAVLDEYGVKLTRLAAAGFSAMMHGYLVFDSSGKQLVPFRTWRNNITGEASAELTGVLSYPIPQRWSIAHHLSGHSQQGKNMWAASPISRRPSQVMFTGNFDGSAGAGCRGSLRHVPDRSSKTQRF